MSAIHPHRFHAGHRKVTRLEGVEAQASFATERTTMSNLANDLRQFTGTEKYYRHNLVRAVQYTDGVKYLAETAGAYWLIDKIATNQMTLRVGKEEFQNWRLVVVDGNAVLTCDDGNGRVLHTEDITFTDFPLPLIELWVEGGIILLPSEH